MNKHLLETRVRSLKHYNSELQKLSNTKKVVEEVKRELLQSFAEFLPFQEGDLLINGDQIIKLGALKHINEDDADEQGFHFYMELFLPAQYGGFQVSPNTQSFTLKEFSEFKKIN